MAHRRGEPAAVRVYTICDESKYLIVRNVAALGCGDELAKLFGSYGPIEECKPMDSEECEQYTDVFFIKFMHVSNARLAKRKLDEYVFYGNRLQVSYAPQFESLLDTQEKLEVRRKEVLSRNKATSGRAAAPKPKGILDHASVSNGSRHSMMHVSSDREYFPSESMNATVRMVRDKLDKTRSALEGLEAVAAAKRSRVDYRRRI